MAGRQANPLGFRSKRAWLLGGCGVVLLAALVLGLMATWPVTPPWLQIPNPAHQYDAIVKWRLLEDSRRLGRKGYVRFSEVEINSHVGDWLVQRREAVGEGGGDLPKRICFELKPDRVNLYYWFDSTVLGRPRESVWIRTLKFNPNATGASRWSLSEIRLGRAPLPKFVWGRVLGWLSQTDRRLADTRFEWVLENLNCVLSKDVQSGLPELRIYTHPQIPDKSG